MEFTAEMVMQLIFLLLFLAYGVFTAVLYYHWKNYSTDGRVTSITLTSYLILTLPLIATMGITALIIT